MPRIAIVCRWADGHGGTTRTILEHSKRLSKLGWAVDVVAERLDRCALRLAGARGRWRPGLPLGSWLKRRSFAALADWRVAWGYDIVHGHGDNFTQDVLSLHNCVHAAHEAVRGLPLPESAGVGRVHERILREGLFRRLIANSRMMAEEVQRRFGVAPEKIVVVYPGHDPLRFRTLDRSKLREPTRLGLGFTEDDFVVGLVTSGDFEKRGVGRFLAALGRLSKRRPEVRGLVAGKDDFSPYRKLAAEAGLEGKVVFAPAIDLPERYYHALDLYAHPALYEEFGQSVQEALACGLPVVCGQRVGAAELLPAEGRELLVEGSSVEALEAVLERAVEGSALRWRLSSAGPRAVAANTWDANFAATLAVYESLLGSKRAK